MHKNIFLSIHLVCSFGVFASNEPINMGARSRAMANSSVLFQDVWSAYNNQAGLAFLNQNAVGLYFENRFGLKELNNLGLVFAQPLKKGTFGVSLQNFGSKNYGESKFGISYALKFSEKISGGIGINTHHTRIIGDYGSKISMTAELGFQSKLTENLSLGMHLFNPTRTKIAEFTDERIPTIIKIGASYQFNKQILGVIEVEKDLLYNPDFKFGLEYFTNEMLYLRAGISTAPSLASFGLGVKKNQIQIDIAASYHEVLGFTPEIGMVWNISKTESK